MGGSNFHLSFRMRTDPGLQTYSRAFWSKITYCTIQNTHEYLFTKTIKK